MATQIIDYKGIKNNGTNEPISEEMLRNKIEVLTEEDEDDDSIVLSMSDMSELAEAMALIKVGLERISEITQVDISEEAAKTIVSALS